MSITTETTVTMTDTDGDSIDFRITPHEPEDDLYSFTVGESLYYVSGNDLSYLAEHIYASIAR